MEKVIKSVTQWLDNIQIRYMIFGGIAVSYYGMPRQTFDIDIKIAVESQEKKEKFINDISKRAFLLVKNPSEFIHDTNVLPVEFDKVRIDFVFAELPFEYEAISRSKIKNIMGSDVRICTPEDLIIHKAVSIRQKDWIDIENVILPLGESLEWEYILKNCKDLSVLLNRPEIIDKITGLRDAK